MPKLRGRRHSWKREGEWATMHQLRTEGGGTAHQERRFTHLRSHRIQAPRDHHSGKTKVIFPRIHQQLPQGVRTLRRVVESIHVLYARHSSCIHRICDNLNRVVPVIVRSRAPTRIFSTIKTQRQLSSR